MFSLSLRIPSNHCKLLSSIGIYAKNTIRKQHCRWNGTICYVMDGVLANQSRQLSTLPTHNPNETCVDQFLRAIREGSFADIYTTLPYVPGNIIDINIMNILNCCYQSSDISKLLRFFIDSKFYISSYMYESIIITAGRIGDSKLVSMIYEASVKKNGNTVSLRDALLHAYRVCDAHQKVISYTYQLFSDNVEITSCQYEDILRTLICHEEYDSLCEHILSKMKLQGKYISLPILSVLLNTLDIRSPSLSILLINQTRYYKENPPLLSLLLSREMMKFSEKQNPKGMIVVYKEMARRGIHPSVSEMARLKRAIALLMKNGESFDIPADDDVFTSLWCEDWLELRNLSDETIECYIDLLRHSKRNHAVEYYELLKYIISHNSFSISLSLWKKLLDLKIVITTQEMVDLIERIDDTSNINNIQGIVLYIEEVYLAKKHQSRRHSNRQVSQDIVILNRLDEIKKKYQLSGSFKKLYETLNWMENCLQSDVFLYITCGMVVANPDEGIKLFNEMVDQGKIQPNQAIIHSIDGILAEKGISSMKESFDKKYKSFM